MNLWKLLNTPIEKLFSRKQPQPQPQKRGYAGAAQNRLTWDWITSGTSQDSELLSSLRTLRNRSRQLCRDNDYARGAVRTIVTNVVGRGVRMQSQVRMRRGGGRLDETVNDAIESLWAEWGCRRYCHTAGKLSFSDIERLIMRSVVESGEIIIRLVSRSFDGSPVPLSLEVIEADQLVDDWAAPSSPVTGNQIRMGVEVDEWQRPVAYWLYPHHPGDYQFPVSSKTSRLLRVPANEIIHLYVCERPGQTRGVPWFYSTLTRLRNMGGYEEAELIAARAQAAVMGFIESPDDPQAFVDGQNEAGQSLKGLEPGAIEFLAPGEKFAGFAPTRPGTGFDPFIRTQLRAVASGIGLSYESLSRDYSNTNYSSARVALLEDRENWQVFQNWLVEGFHQVVFECWLEMAVLSNAIDLPGYEVNPRVYCCPTWRPKGWSWVDPVKEVTANQMAIVGGMTSLTDVIAAQGGDIEEVFKKRRRELDLAEQYGLTLSSDLSQQEEEDDGTIGNN